MTTVQREKIARRKLTLLQLAQEPGNISKACRLAGYSRQQFSEIRRNYQVLWPEGLRLKGLEVSAGGVPGVWHIETTHTGELVAVDTFFTGTLKGVGRVYLQTVLDCHSRYPWARLYTSQLPLTAVQTLNNDVLPFFERQRANGREFCGRLDNRHPYELFLQLEEIEHRTTRVRRPQSKWLHRALPPHAARKHLPGRRSGILTHDPTGF